MDSLFTEYEQVTQEMMNIVTEEFIAAKFFINLKDGAFTHRQLQYFATQYGYYSRNFPRILGAAISAMEPSSKWWAPIADNLWDEAGRGIANKTHEQLYRTFWLSVDPDILLDRNGLPCEPMSPAVTTAVRTFLQFFYQATPLEAMAAVGLGSELFAGDVMGFIGEALRHPAYNRERQVNTLFWDIHADEHEPRHYNLCRDILLEHRHPDDLRIMFTAARIIAVSEAQMYEGLYHEMIRL